jgi:ABC-2 type transport system ATP-binding protein
MRFKKQQVLKGITLDLPESGLVGFIGANGSGKSTLFKIMAGLIKSHEGSVDYGSLQPTQVHLASLAEKLPSYYTVRQLIKLMCMFKEASEEQANQLIADFQLEGMLHKKVNELSQGYGQRLHILCTLLGDAQVLLFDESHNGLDPEILVVFRQYARQRAAAGKLVILSSHILLELEGLCDSFIFIKEGELVTFASKEELLSEYSSVEQAYLRLLGHQVEG